MNDDKIYVFSNDMYRGLKGRAIAALMNRIHKPVHAWFAEHINIQNAHAVLDIGCGGGGLLKQILKRTSGQAYGIDYSNEMVQITTRVNKKEYMNQRAHISAGTVSTMPYSYGMWLPHLKQCNSGQISWRISKRLEGC